MIDERLPRHPLPIEQATLRAMQSTAPAGHQVIGPLPDPPFFKCSCGCRFSNAHPRPRPTLPGMAERIARREEVADWMNR